MSKERLIERLDIKDYETIEGEDAIKISQSWLAVFCPSRKSFKGIKRFKTYMWDIMGCDLDREEAIDFYSKLEAPRYIIMEDCFGCDNKEVYIVSRKPKSNEGLRDFHVFPKNLAWSMAFTHEDGWIGPQLSKSKDFEKLNTQNVRAMEAIKRIKGFGDI